MDEDAEKPLQDTADTEEEFMHMTDIEDKEAVTSLVPEEDVRDYTVVSM